MNDRGLAFEERTLAFSLEATDLCRDLTHTWEGRLVAGQLFRAATGMASNYRAARRGRSHREFVAKLGIALEEADESVFWLVFVHRSKMNQSESVTRLSKEAEELLAIIAASVKTAATREQEARNAKRRPKP